MEWKLHSYSRAHYSYLAPTTTVPLGTFEKTQAAILVFLDRFFIPFLILGIVIFIVYIAHRHKNQAGTKKPVIYFALFLILALLFKLFVLNCMYTLDYGVKWHQACFAPLLGL